MNENKFIEYIQANPKLFAITKSDMCLGLLRLLSKNGLPLKEIKDIDYYNKFSDDDLNILLNLLVGLKLLSTEMFGHKKIYYANKNTTEFLEMYDKTKKNYDIA